MGLTPIVGKPWMCLTPVFGSLSMCTPSGSMTVKVMLAVLPSQVALIVKTPPRPGALKATTMPLVEAEAAPGAADILPPLACHETLLEAPLPLPEATQVSGVKVKITTSPTPIVLRVRSKGGLS